MTAVAAGVLGGGGLGGYGAVGGPSSGNLGGCRLPALPIPGRSTTNEAPSVATSSPTAKEQSKIQKDESWLLPANVALVRKIRIALVNHAHLDMVVNEAFQTTLGERLQQSDDPSISVTLTGSASPEPAADYETAIGLVCSILERMHIPYTERSVKAWAAQACSTFAHSRDKANIMTASRVRFVVQWVLRCLSEFAIRGTPDFFNRSFLEGFRHNTQIGTSGLLLAGAVAHGVYGNIWLHAKDKKPALTNQSASPRHVRSDRADRTSFDTILASRAPSTSEHVVCSMSKSLCKLPPELMNKRIKFLIDMDPIPYVLPLRDAYEDYEHIHLVYDSLSSNAMCLIDKVFEDMHSTEEEQNEDFGFSERTVQQIVWRILTASKEAHSRGLVHGSLRMGCCYLNDPEALDSLQILEFGLADIFEIPAATPPATILTPMGNDRPDPVPLYRRDLQCIAEITYLLLLSHPIASLNSTSEELAQRFRRGTACFDFAGFRDVTENAKAFVSDVLRPPPYKKPSKIQACHEVAVHMNHRWFYPDSSSVSAMTELYDLVMMRRYDTWRNTLRLRTNFFKISADHMSLSRIGQLWDRLAALADGKLKVSWSAMVPEILKRCPVLHLLQKVNKAFGESEELATIPIKETRRTMEAWRRKRVREVVWQVFNRAKAFNGRLAADVCAEGLVGKVLHVWSRPLRVVDVLEPAEVAEVAAAAPQGIAETNRKVTELIGHAKFVTFLDLLSRTDAADSL